MKSWIIGWHPESNTHQRYEFRCSTGPIEEDALSFLVETMRARYPEERALVVRWCVPKPEEVKIERTCGYCHQTRYEVVDQGPLEPPGFFTKDSHLWRTLDLRHESA